MRLAIIDIGYNAVRAVVYDSDKLGAPEIFSDKFKSDIINLFSQESLEIKHQVYLSIGYMMHIFSRLSVKSIRCVATAVLRGHPRADEFQQIIKKKFNLDIEIISGDREAYLTAVGLISGISDASGIVADLGGGSLEIAYINDKKVGILKSFPLGTSLHRSAKLDDIKLIADMIGQEFGRAHYSNLYLIGGVLRVIGRSYMEFINYPLKNLHNLEISSAEFELYLEKIACANKMHYVSKIRSNAILVTKAILKTFSPSKIIISNYGLKEGVRFDSLEKSEQEKDIIYERIKTLLNFNESESDIAIYVELIKPILIDPDEATIKIISLVLILAQYNKNIDKTLRSNFIVEFILSSDIPFTHRQRLMLSTALSITYTSKNDSYINTLAKKMINRQDYYNSLIIGNIIKVARVLDGPEFTGPSFSLIIKNNYYIEIDTNRILPRVIFEKVCERLKNIGLARKNIY